MKKLVVAFLIIVLVASLLPMSALAYDNEYDTRPGYHLYGHTLVINPPSAMKELTLIYYGDEEFVKGIVTYSDGKTVTGVISDDFFGSRIVFTLDPGRKDWQAVIDAQPVKGNTGGGVTAIFDGMMVSGMYSNPDHKDGVDIEPRNGYRETRIMIDPAKLSDIADNPNKDSIIAVVANGDMYGMDGKFFPQGFVTNAELSDALYRRFSNGQKSPEQNAMGTARTSWFYDAVNWMIGKGIIKYEQDDMPNSGYSLEYKNATVFWKSHMYMSKQEFISAVYNAVTQAGVVLSPKSNIQAFADNAQVASVFQEAVNTFRQAGVLPDEPGNKLNPGDFLTREYAAVVFDRLYRLTGVYKQNPVAPALQAIPTASRVLIDGREVAFNAYNINGNNYFMLRDLAYTLSGTSKQFDVGWDGLNSTIVLTSDKSYTVVGSEMTGKGVDKKTPLPTSSKIVSDGEAISPAGFNIEGNNYFKLRDIGQEFDFGVEWDGANNTIIINTSVGYTP
jgi:Copper amine oxidase N-terminal domain.